MSADASELEQLLQFVYQCPSAIVRMRRDGAIDLANPLAVGLLLPLAPSGDLTNLLDLLDPVAPSIRSAVASFAGEAGVIVDQTQATLRDAGGQPCIIAITIVAIDRETCVAVMSDVTRVVAQERRLYIHEQRLSAIIDSVRDYAIFTLDPDGRVDSWNRSLERLTGMDAEGVLGLPLASLAVDRTHLSLADLLATARRQGWAEYALAHRRLPSAEFWGEAVVTPLLGPDEEVTGFGVVLRDATVKRRYEEELLRLAMHDQLTGVANRRAFFEAAEREKARSRESGRDLSLLIIDVDYFKRINDTYGHAVGDQMLRAIAVTAVKALGARDVLGRLGGEEFGVLAPETPLAEAVQLAERLRAAIAEIEVVIPDKTLRVTISAGVALIRPGSSEPFEAALHRADEALYTAKRGGRNRVAIGDNIPETRRAS